MVYPVSGAESLVEPTTTRFTHPHWWPSRNADHRYDMADKSPRKQNKGKKLTTKEKQDKKKAKKKSGKDAGAAFPPTKKSG